MSRALDIAKKVLDGTEITTDEVKELAAEYHRIASQAKPGEANIAAPPADREQLRRDVEGLD